MQQLADTQSRLEQTVAPHQQAEEEKMHLLNAHVVQPMPSEPPLVHLPEEALTKVKSLFLDALPRHVVHLGAPEAGPKPPNFFINRQ